MEDIEIVENIKSEKIEIEQEEEDKEQVIVRSTLDDIRRVCYVKKGSRPPIEELFKDLMWNPITKTGIKELTPEFIKTMYYDLQCQN